VTETVAIGGIPLKLIDTAGIRHSTDEAESIGIRKSYEALSEADMVLVVLDSSRDLGGEDHELVGACAGRRALAVANKADLAPARALEVDGMKVYRTSAVTGEGVDSLRQEILSQISGQSGGEQEAGFLTNIRHRRLVEESLASLEAASQAAERKIPHEMIMLDLYGALRPLDAITGETTTDDILNLIFSSFCIGK
jgi:tRNA modification GTPase